MSVNIFFNVRETLSFQHTLVFSKQPEISWSQVRRVRRMIMAEMPLPAENRQSKQRMCRLVVLMKNQWAICPHFSSLAPRSINKPFQHHHVECLINSGPSGYEFKVDVTPDVEKAGPTLFSSWTLTSVASLAWGFTVNCFKISNVSFCDFCSLKQKFAFTVCSIVRSVFTSEQNWWHTVI
jgi:hypothetical protein